MRERPILFSAPMVRALLAGTKTQTRRVIKLPSVPSRLGQWEPFFFGGKGCRDSKGREISGRWTIGHSRTGAIIGCPHGEAGDRLWVRETWAPQADCEVSAERWTRTGVHHGPKPILHFAADMSPRAWVSRWRPSIHMPRWASRITLEITEVRVQRLQDISETDAVAEGIRISSQARRSDTCYGIYECLMPDGKTHFNDSAYDLYRLLWEQINGPGSWDANPWVWPITFRNIP